MTERRKDIRIVGQKAITTVGQLDRRTIGLVGQKDRRTEGRTEGRLENRTMED